MRDLLPIETTCGPVALCFRVVYIFSNIALQSVFYVECHFFKRFHFKIFQVVQTQLAVGNLNKSMDANTIFCQGSGDFHS